MPSDRSSIPSGSSSRSAALRPRGRPAGRTFEQGVIADRDTLLDAAEKLIRRQGPSVSLAAIASTAGVTKPILYREVGDKDELVNALARRLSERMAAAAMRLVAAATTPQEGLHNLVTAYLDLASRERALYLFVTAGGTGEDRVQQSLLLADGAAEQFAAPIAAYRTAHDADPAVATVWSYGLLGALHYVTLWWLREPDVDIHTVVAQISALLWRGMTLE